MSSAHVPLEATLMGEFGWADESEWTPGSEAEELADALRSVMSEEYAGATDEAMYDALDAVLGSVSPAEAFNLSRALNQAAQGASKLVKDPTFLQIAGTAAPIVGGLIGGPVGAGLGTLASKALLGAAAPPASPAPPPASPPPLAVPPSPLQTPTPEPTLSPPLSPAVAAIPPPANASVPIPPVAHSSELPVPGPSPASALAGGSTAAAQAVVLMQQSDVLRSLLATALGRHGCRRVSGIPVAQVLELVSRVVGQAAADADQLMYTELQPDISEEADGEAVAGSYRSLYADLIGTDNLAIAEAAEAEGLV